MLLCFAGVFYSGKYYAHDYMFVAVESDVHVVYMATYFDGGVWIDVMILRNRTLDTESVGAKWLVQKGKWGILCSKAQMHPIIRP